MTNTARRRPAAAGTVWASCRLQVIDGARWRTVAEGITWTPRGINDALRAAGLTAGWILGPTGREYWTAGREIARTAR